MRVAQSIAFSASEAEMDPAWYWDLGLSLRRRPKVLARSLPDCPAAANPPGAGFVSHPLDEAVAQMNQTVQRRVREVLTVQCVEIGAADGL